MKDERLPDGLPIAADGAAESAEAGVPAFIARPNGAPIYHGFKVLNDVAVDGFVLGIISDFEAGESTWGDAFVIAPDDSRAGLVWELGDAIRITEIHPMGPHRWGVWSVTFTLKMTNRENARRNLEAVLPLLIPKWKQWQRTLSGGPQPTD